MRPPSSYRFRSIKLKVYLVLGIALLAFTLLSPSTKTYGGTYHVYDSSAKAGTGETMEIVLNLTQNNKLPFVAKKYDVALEVDGNTFHYSTTPEQPKTDLSMPLVAPDGNQTFGTLIPTKGYKEFVLLFDGNYHANPSGGEFVALPDRELDEALQLFDEAVDFGMKP